MDSTITTGDELVSCLSILKSQPMTAAQIAARLRLSGCRETQRRSVRAMVEVLRDKGCRIVATNRDGYFLTTDEKVWRDYLEGRQIDAKTVLGRTHGQIRQMRFKAQGLLFGQRFTNGAYAECGTITRK